MSGLQTTAITLKEASEIVAWVACVSLSLLFVAGCSGTSVGAGGGTGARVHSGGNAAESPSRNTGKPLRVLRLDYQGALDLALQVSEEIFTNAEETNRGTVSIHNNDFWLGDVTSEITPQIVENLDEKGEFGIIFKLESHGATLTPGYVNTMFFEKITTMERSGVVATEWFSNYRILKDQGVTENIHDSIPVTYEGFKRYIDSKENTRQHEGIWTDVDGNYTVGIIYDERDKRYRYKAFIIETNRKNWNPGEIKFKINSLHGRGLVFGPYHFALKNAGRVVWEVGDSTLVALNNKKLAFFKIHPQTGAADSVGDSVGTGWAVSADGIFVTNAHVVEDAKKIFVGFRGATPARARVLAVDRRVDLALLKVGNSSHNRAPIPLSSGKTFANGLAVTVIGYPLAFTLGDDPRVTDGIISAQSGYDKDPTRFQISAPIQPGNSGGPVLGPDGSIVGVAVSRLSGSDVQNVNFAVKNTYLKLLLDSAGVPYRTLEGGRRLTPSEIYKKYGKSVLPVWAEY